MLVRFQVPADDCELTQHSKAASPKAPRPGLVPENKLIMCPHVRLAHNRQGSHGALLDRQEVYPTTGATLRIIGTSIPATVIVVGIWNLLGQGGDHGQGIRGTQTHTVTSVFKENSACHLCW